LTRLVANLVSNLVPNRALTDGCLCGEVHETDSCDRNGGGDRYAVGVDFNTGPTAFALDERVTAALVVLHEA